MNYTVYILRNSEGVYYKGYTSDICRRLYEHNDDTRHKFTSTRGPWELVYSRGFDNKREALIEERRLKRLNKRSIEALISEHKYLC